MKLKIARPSREPAVNRGGAPGVVRGVTITLADGALGPTALLATTEQITVMPLVKPVTMSGDAMPDALDMPQVAVYPVIGLPPLETDSVKATVTCALPGVTTPITGVSGAMAVIVKLCVT